jgi:hypothetical protein
MSRRSYLLVIVCANERAHGANTHIPSFFCCKTLRRSRLHKRLTRLFIARREYDRRSYFVVCHFLEQNRRPISNRRQGATLPYKIAAKPRCATSHVAQAFLPVLFVNAPTHKYRRSTSISLAIPKYRNTHEFAIDDPLIRTAYCVASHCSNPQA